MASLFVGKSRKRPQIFQRQGLFLCKRGVFSHKHVGLCGKELLKNKVVVTKSFLNDGLVKAVQVKYADLAAKMRHVINYVICLRLAHVEFIFVAAILPKKLYKRLYRKGIVLRRNSETLLALRFPFVPFAKQVRLL